MHWKLVHVAHTHTHIKDTPPWKSREIAILFVTNCTVRLSISSVLVLFLPSCQLHENIHKFFFTIKGTALDFFHRPQGMLSFLYKNFLLLLSLIFPFTHSRMWKNRYSSAPRESFFKGEDKLFFFSTRYMLRQHVLLTAYNKLVTFIRRM